MLICNFLGNEKLSNLARLSWTRETASLLPESLNAGTPVPGGVISINVSESFDGSTVHSPTQTSEVVCRGD